MAKPEIEFQKIASDEYIVTSTKATGLPVRLGVLSTFKGDWFFGPAERNNLGGQINLGVETLKEILTKLKELERSQDGDPH